MGSIYRHNFTKPEKRFGSIQRNQGKRFGVDSTKPRSFYKVPKYSWDELYESPFWPVCMYVKKNYGQSFFREILEHFFPRNNLAEVYQTITDEIVI
jgi:hypothetical protein